MFSSTASVHARKGFLTILLQPAAPAVSYMGLQSAGLNTIGRLQKPYVQLRITTIKLDALRMWTPNGSALLVSSLQARAICARQRTEHVLELRNPFKKL